MRTTETLTFYNSKVATYKTLTPDELCDEYYSIRMSLSELSRDVNDNKIKLADDYEKLKLYLEDMGVYHSPFSGTIKFITPIKPEEKKKTKVRLSTEEKSKLVHMEDFLKSSKNVDFLRLKIREMKKKDALIKAMEEDD